MLRLRRGVCKGRAIVIDENIAYEAEMMITIPISLKLTCQRNESDVIVVGSGMSGAPCAWMLSEMGHNVLLIESGREILNTELPIASIDVKKRPEFNPVASSRSNYGDYPVDDKNSPISVILIVVIIYSLFCHYPRFINSDFNINSSEGLGVDWPINMTNSSLIMK